MPRKPRLFVPACVHHIMARGIDGMDIFCDDEDRDAFVRLLGQHIRSTDMRCYAWALLPNHYHLVVRTSDTPLAALMKPLNSQYARRYNLRYDRRGYLFQDRFRSIATQEQLYTQELVRYVHLNPIRAGLCATLAELGGFAWCGHAAVMGKRSCAFQDTQSVLRCFGQSARESRLRYWEFLQQGLGAGEDDFPRRIRSGMHGRTDREEPGHWVIGDPQFVRDAVDRDRRRRLRIARFAAEGWDMARLGKRIAGHVGTTVDALKVRSRGGAASDGRRLLAHIGHHELDIPVAEIARFLGISGPAVSKMLPDGRRSAARLDITKLLS